MESDKSSSNNSDNAPTTPEPAATKQVLLKQLADLTVRLQQVTAEKEQERAEKEQALAEIGQALAEIDQAIGEIEQERAEKDKELAEKDQAFATIGEVRAANALIDVAALVHAYTGFVRQYADNVFDSSTCSTSSVQKSSSSGGVSVDNSAVDPPSHKDASSLPVPPVTLRESPDLAWLTSLKQQLDVLLKQKSNKRGQFSEIRHVHPVGAEVVHEIARLAGLSKGHVYAQCTKRQRVSTTSGATRSTRSNKRLRRASDGASNATNNNDGNDNDNDNDDNDNDNDNHDLSRFADALISDHSEADILTACVQRKALLACEMKRNLKTDLKSALAGGFRDFVCTMPPGMPRCPPRPMLLLVGDGIRWRLYQLVVGYGTGWRIEYHWCDEMNLEANDAVDFDEYKLKLQSFVEVCARQLLALSKYTNDASTLPSALERQWPPFCLGPQRPSVVAALGSRGCRHVLLVDEGDSELCVYKVATIDNDVRFQEELAVIAAFPDIDSEEATKALVVPKRHKLYKYWFLKAPYRGEALQDKCLCDNKLQDKIVEWINRDIRPALKWMHDKGWAFGDIQPGNIVVDKERAYLIDFESAWDGKMEKQVHMHRQGFTNKTDPTTKESDEAALEKVIEWVRNLRK